MGRHVNYADEQDRWLNKADKLNRKPKFKSERLEDKDPNSLTLAEQLELKRRREKASRERLSEKNPIIKEEPIRISHYNPNKK
jgi:hypothetical protein